MTDSRNITEILKSPERKISSSVLRSNIPSAMIHCEIITSEMILNLESDVRACLRPTIVDGTLGQGPLCIWELINCPLLFTPVLLLPFALFIEINCSGLFFSHLARFTTVVFKLKKTDVCYSYLLICHIFAAPRTIFVTKSFLQTTRQDF